MPRVNLLDAESLLEEERTLYTPEYLLGLPLDMSLENEIWDEYQEPQYEDYPEEDIRDYDPNDYYDPFPNDFDDLYLYGS